MDINSLTLGEVAKVEDLSGLPIASISEADKPKGRALAALAFVFQKRKDPKFTWNQAQDLTLSDANEILGISKPAELAAQTVEVEVEAESESEAIDPFMSRPETSEI